MSDERRELERAAEAIIDTSGDFQIGRVISRTFDILRRNALVFLTLSVLFMLPLLLLGLQGASHEGPQAPASGGRTLAFQIFFVGTLAFFIAVLSVIPYVLQALLVARALAGFRGDHDPAFAGLRSWWRASAIGLFSILGIGLGFALLVLPGLFFMAAWFVAVPICVTENRGVFASLERSMALTQGCRGAILGLLAMNFVLWLGLEVVIVFIPRLLGLHSATSYLVANYVLQWVALVAVVMLSAAGTAATYHELRLAKEGLDAHQLADAFA